MRPSASRRSRVTPGVSSTSAIFRPTSRLNSVDLPTLGRPTMATVTLSWLAPQASPEPVSRGLGRRGRCRCFGRRRGCRGFGRCGRRGNLGGCRCRGDFSRSRSCGRLGRSRSGRGFLRRCRRGLGGRRGRDFGRSVARNFGRRRRRRLRGGHRLGHRALRDQRRDIDLHPALEIAVDALVGGNVLEGLERGIDVAGLVLGKADRLAGGVAQRRCPGSRARRRAAGRAATSPLSTSTLAARTSASSRMRGMVSALASAS